jgi:hypothetical protein
LKILHNLHLHRYAGRTGGFSVRMHETLESEVADVADRLRMIGTVGVPNLAATDWMNEAVGSVRAPQTALQAAHFRSAQWLPVGWLMMAMG